MIITSFSGKYRFLSNFYRLPDGYTTEHLYQSEKTDSEDEQVYILLSPTPGEAKRRGRHVTLKKDWGRIKDDVMLKLLRKKFAITELKQKLLDTGEAYLEEGNNWGDTYWGTVNGIGENRLGKMLMQVREEIRRSGGGND